MTIQLLINGISLGAIYAIIAVGFALIFSILRFSNFAHGAIISATAYIAYFFQNSFDPAPPLVVTTIVSALAGMVIILLVDTIGFRNIRKNLSPRIYFFVASITIAIMIEEILSVFFGKNFFGFPSIFEKTTFEFMGITFATMDIIVLAISAGLLVVLMLIINKTRLGLAIRTVAIDVVTSKLMGVNTDVIIIFSFALAGLLAGVSGVFLGIKYSVYPSLGSSIIVKGFMASVIGGLGSLTGAIIAATVLGVVEMLLIYNFGSTITPALLLIVVLVFLFVRPQGILGRIVQDKV